MKPKSRMKKSAVHLIELNPGARHKSASVIEHFRVTEKGCYQMVWIDIMYKYTKSEHFDMQRIWKFVFRKKIEWKIRLQKTNAIERNNISFFVWSVGLATDGINR